MNDRLKTLLSPSVLTPLALAAGAETVRRYRRRQRFLPLGGRSVIVTGATRELGRALAAEYARAEANVTLVDSDMEVLRHVQESIGADGAGRVAIRGCNVRDREDVKSAVEYVLGRFGQIDVLVNGAAIPSSTKRGVELGTMLESYLRTTPYMTIEVAPYMIREERGRIVNVLSPDVSPSVTELFDDGVRSRTLRTVSKELRRMLSPHNVYMTLAVAGPLSRREEGREDGDEDHQGHLAQMIRTDVDKAARKIVEASCYGDPLVATSRAVQMVEKLFGMLPYSLRSSISAVRMSRSEADEGGTSGEDSPSAEKARSAEDGRSPTASSNGAPGESTDELGESGRDTGDRERRENPSATDDSSSPPPTSDPSTS